MLSTYLNALIRTVAGYAVAWLLSLKLAGPVLSALGMDTATAKERATAGFVVVLGTVYYAAAKWLEQKYPSLTVLLGSTKQPVAYSNGQAPGAHASDAPAVIGADSELAAVLVDSGQVPAFDTTDPTSAPPPA
jgi:hypothetical protein